MRLSILLPSFAVFLLSEGLLWSQNSSTPFRDRKMVDSDGDGLSDHEDPHPFVGEIRALAWKISPLRLGWKVDRSYENQISNLTETERFYLRQSHFRLGAGADAKGEFQTEAKGELSRNPFKLFGLADSAAKASFFTKFSASGQINWDWASKKTSSDLFRMVDEIRIRQYLSDLHVDFDVEFYNQTENNDFESTGSLQIPIKGSPNGHVFVWAQPWGANGPIQKIELPAGRNKTPITFRAKLDTTNALDLLTWMKTSSPFIDLMEIQGKIRPVDGPDGSRGADAISTLAKIEAKTSKISVDMDGEIFTWKVAKKDESTGKELLLKDVFAAINGLVPGPPGKGKVFEFTDRYLRSACGSDNSICPLRWWMAAMPGQSGFRDVDPSLPAGREVFLQYRCGFPDDIDRWASLAENDRGKDSWISLVAGVANLRANDGSAVKFLDRAKDSAIAKVALAAVYGAGLAGVQPNMERAGELLREAAKMNEPLALVALAEVRTVELWGFKNEADSVRTLLERAADLNFSPALVRLGLGYRDGSFGLPKNSSEAVSKFEKARALGDVEAMAILGKAYLKGEGGIERNEAKGEVLLEGARELGYAPAREDGSVLESFAARGVLLFPFVNTLGMRFVSVPGTDVLWCEHETRVMDYAAYAAAHPGVNMAWKNAEYKGHQQAPDHPVVNVSWEEAKAFCAWLSAKEGRTYRLPTDHEWSIAVGIGQQEDPKASPEAKDEKASGYPWGTAWPPPTGCGNYKGEEDNGIDGYRDQHVFTAPVKSYRATNGLFDLSGNVWEWCEDWYSGEQSARVLRGGSWIYDAEISLRSSYRTAVLPSGRSGNGGFRCVVSPAR